MLICMYLCFVHLYVCFSNEYMCGTDWFVSQQYNWPPLADRSFTVAAVSSLSRSDSTESLGTEGYLQNVQITSACYALTVTQDGESECFQQNMGAYNRAIQEWMMLFAYFSVIYFVHKEFPYDG